MSILDFANYVAGNSTNFSNLSAQTSGLSASTVDKIKRMEALTNTCSSTTSCFIGLNSPVSAAISSASYIQQMAAILNEVSNSNSVFETAKTSYTTAPVVNTQPEVEAPKSEESKAEEVKTESPKVEAPKAESPKAEAPKTEQNAKQDKTETPDAFNRKKEAEAAEAKKQAENDKMLLDMSEAFKKRHASDKAEAEAAKVKKQAENDKMLLDMSEAFKKRHASDKAEAEAAKAEKQEENNKMLLDMSEAFAKRHASDKAEAEAAKAEKQEENDKMLLDMSEAFAKRHASDKAEAEAAKVRANKIANPQKGSKLSILRSQLETVKELEAKGISCDYLPSLSDLETQVREIESGKAEAALTYQINELEKETENYGETKWFNFVKNSKLEKLEELKEQRANLY